MTLSTYSELKDSVERWLERSDRDTEIQEWARLTEAEVSRKLRLRSQQQSVSGTLTGGSEFLETPAGILYPQTLVFDTQPPRVVQILTLPEGEEFAYANSGDATPTRATVWGVNASTYATVIRVWPAPPADVPYTLYYASGIQALTPAAPANYLLLIAPDLYLHGCLYHGQLFDENPEAATAWRQILNDDIRQVAKIEAMARAKGGRLRVRPRMATP